MGICLAELLGQREPHQAGQDNMVCLQTVSITLTPVLVAYMALASLSNCDTSGYGKMTYTLCLAPGGGKLYGMLIQRVQGTVGSNLVWWLLHSQGVLLSMQLSHCWTV